MKEQDLLNKLQEIQMELSSLSNKITTENQIGKNTIHLHIQHVSIESLQLDELAYHLDSIDIKELSGMLNLGNSFSPKIMDASSKQKNSEKADDKKENSEKDNEKAADGENPAVKGSEGEGNVRIVVNGKETSYKLR
jgi:ribosomal protein L12E/L44/L45/RPP1/RPP2